MHFDFNVGNSCVKCELACIFHVVQQNFSLELEVEATVAPRRSTVAIHLYVSANLSMFGTMSLIVAESVLKWKMYSVSYSDWEIRSLIYKAL